MTWTAADAAEQDVLVHELAEAYSEHRERCRACQRGCPFVAAYLEHRDGCWKCRNGVKVATVFYGEPCPRHLEFVRHGDDCVTCLPCPHLRNAIDGVLDWRRRRELLSRAEALRIAQRAAGIHQERAA